MTNNLLSFRVPPGIGDISWIYSKLAGLGRPLRIEVADSGPRRALPYLELLPLVKESCYVKAPNPANMRGGKALPSWSAEQLVSAASEDIVPIDLNCWLEAGNRIEDFIPNIPTVHHYPIDIEKADGTFAGWGELNARLCFRFVCFYCANADTVRRWHGWKPAQWASLARLLFSQFSLDGIVLLGAKWDRPFADEVHAALHVRVVDLVGKLPLAGTLYIISRSRYLVAFPSGIPILATVLSRPTVMFYPDSLKGLMTSWVPRDVLDDGTYKAMPFCEPERVFEWIKERL